MRNFAIYNTTNMKVIRQSYMKVSVSINLELNCFASLQLTQFQTFSHFHKLMEITSITKAKLLLRKIKN